LKTCNRCREYRELSLFSNDASKKDGKRTICKVCDKVTQATESFKAKARLRKRIERHTRPEIQMFNFAKKRAKNKRLPFNIEMSDIIIPEFCPILGIKLKTNIGIIGDDSITLDKIVPELGYIKGNILVVSNLANKMKSSATIEQLITFSESILRMFKVDESLKSSNRSEGNTSVESSTSVH
jgi:hypothetical protein